MELKFELRSLMFEAEPEQASGLLKHRASEIPHTVNRPAFPSKLPTLEAEIARFVPLGDIQMRVSHHAGQLIALLERIEAHRLDAEDRAQKAIAVGMLDTLKEAPEQVLGTPVHAPLKGLFFDPRARPFNGGGKGGGGRT